MSVKTGQPHDQFRTALAPTQSIHWPTGEFFPGWHPFGSDNTTVNPHNITAASIALGHAAG